jgi:GEVED domain
VAMLVVATIAAAAEVASTIASGRATSPVAVAVTPATVAVTPATVAVTPATVAVTPATVAVTPATVAVTPACRNGFYVVSGESLVRYDEVSNRYLRIATLPGFVNALAYAPGPALVYGIAGSRIVTIDTGGHLVDRGAAPHGTSGAYVGAIAGNRWFLRSGGAMSVLSIDRSSSAYLHVIAVVPVHIDGELGDWDINPSDRSLYGIAAGGGPARLVRVDPQTGAVTVVAHPRGLPPHDNYGAIAIGDGGLLTAFDNATGRSYSLLLAHPSLATIQRAGGTVAPAASGHADAAGCPSAWDFGDAPASYGTTLAANGPRHMLTSAGTLTIGSSVSADPNGRPSTSASADADDGPRDPVSITKAAGPIALSVPVRNSTGHAALLAGWLDGNDNGTFEVNERAVATVPPGATAVTLRWAAGLTGHRVQTFLRLRLYGEPTSNPSPLGAALGGEVEDHLVRVVTPAPVPASPLPVPSPTTPPPIPKAAATPPSHTPPPLQQLAAAHVTHLKPPWQPSRKTSLDWSVVLLMLIPAAALTVRAAGRARHRR